MTRHHHGHAFLVELHLALALAVRAELGQLGLLVHVSEFDVSLSRAEGVFKDRRRLAEGQAAEESPPLPAPQQAEQAKEAELAAPPELPPSYWDEEGDGKPNASVLKRALADTVLVDAAWLARLADAGDILPRCQDLPEGARVTLDEMEQLARRQWSEQCEPSLTGFTVPGPPYPICCYNFARGTSVVEPFRRLLLTTPD